MARRARRDAETGERHRRREGRRTGWRWRQRTWELLGVGAVGPDREGVRWQSALPGERTGAPRRIAAVAAYAPRAPRAARIDEQEEQPMSTAPERDQAAITRSYARS